MKNILLFLRDNVNFGARPQRHTLFDDDGYAVAVASDGFWIVGVVDNAMPLFRVDNDLLHANRKQNVLNALRRGGGSILVGQGEC